MGSVSTELSYFTCTLSEAQDHNRYLTGGESCETADGTILIHDHYRDVTGFLEYLATNYGSQLAIGCVIPLKDVNEVGRELLTFAEVLQRARCIGQHLRELLDPRQGKKTCVALIASSSVIFSLVWLGLVLEKYEVLLVAPQTTPDAIRHLIEQSNTFAVCCDIEHQQIAQDSIAGDSNIQQILLPWASLEDCKDTPQCISTQPQGRTQDNPTAKKYTVDAEVVGRTAFYFHSSGTTGLPKLIPITHNGAVGVLPLLQDSDSSLIRSTFTTTPLYHGGIADLLRSWSAASPIWLFPEGKIPIIGSTVKSCLGCIDDIHGSKPGSTLGYLSCVPYVLESLTGDTELYNRLRAFDAVGVGGASMPKELGDRLVEGGIRLVSRFGSAECGFLLSSHRDYSSDAEWDVLRGSKTVGLQYQQIQEGKYELRVTKDWPLVSTASHASRPFNTHDMFERSGLIPCGWKYIGRSDSQITLKTGKKFDPVPMEDALKTSDLIDIAIIIGDDRPYTAAIIFITEFHGELEKDEAACLVWSHIQTVNKAFPPHARLAKTSYLILCPDQRKRLRMNSKGGIVRSAFLTDFSEDIGGLYSTGSSSTYLYSFDLSSPEVVQQWLLPIVHGIVGDDHNLSPVDDFYQAGVDSALAVQIRNSICKGLPNHLSLLVPANVVYECGSIQSLSRFIARLQQTDTDGFDACPQGRDKSDEMVEMVEKHLESQTDVLSRTQQLAELSPGKQSLFHGGSGNHSDNDRRFLLTGSTGFLGIHILQQLLLNKSATKIYLLIRAASGDLSTSDKSEARIHNLLSQHCLLSVIPPSALAKIVYLPFQLQHPLLGLSRNMYNHLVVNVTDILHCAWDVNFALSLQSFEPQMTGIVHLWNMFDTSYDTDRRNLKTFTFCSSVASVANLTKVSETPQLSTFPTDAGTIGYAQSKWVAENIIDGLRKRRANTYCQVSVSILRIGQLSADSKTGIWNRKEAWPIMLNSCLQGFEGEVIVPNLAETTLPDIDWLPVDVAARRSLSIIKNCNAQHGVNFINIQGAPATNWEQVQSYICSWVRSQGRAGKLIDAESWLELIRIRDIPEANPLLELWKEGWKQRNGEAKALTSPESARMRDDGRDYDIDRAYIQKILDWVTKDS